MLEIEGVHVRLGDRDVLTDVSVQARARSTTALLGPSGSGKTTLLRAVAGLQPLTSGVVRLDGRDLVDVPPHERHVGLMFQDYALFPHRSVGANVEFGLRMRGDDRADRRQRVDEVLRLVGLQGFEDRSVSQLSGGERQRVALARSLAPAPRVLMLDEPLGSLDRTLRDQLVLDLRELFEALELTVVYVTHDQAEALALADSVVVLEEGRVVQAAEPHDLWSRPATPFVARFLGFTNLVPVSVSGGEIRASFGAIGERGEWPDGPATALIRPNAVELVASSALVGRVRSRAFRGDRTTVEIDLDGAMLEASVEGAGPDLGATVAIAIAPTGLQLFAGPAASPHPGSG
jgi:thiamine transport system ATP-binding protein